MTKSWIVVTDSAQVRIFDADSSTKECTEIAGLIHPESRLHGRDLTASPDGRTFDSVGGGRHGMSQHQSPHEHEANLFARRIAEWLSISRATGEFEHLQLAAPPAFLGMLRKSLDDNIRQSLEHVVTKNLIHETPDSIAVHFFGPRDKAKARTIQ